MLLPVSFTPTFLAWFTYLICARILYQVRYYILNMSLSPLLLSHSDGMTTTFFGKNKDIPASEKFVQAMVNGGASYYVVYERPNFNKDHPDAGYVILLDEPNIYVDWVIRSFGGFDRMGITLYQHHTISGEGHHFT